MSSINNNPDQYRLSEEQHELIFQKKIKPILFKGVETVDKPVAIIFGGQPGAGKSIAVDMGVEQITQVGKPVLIIGDEFRDLHPRYRKLLRQDDKTAAFYTDRDTGLWVEKAITHAKNLHCNLIIEGTMRVTEKVVETMKSLRDSGYTIEACALAVNERLSWQGVLQRYEKQRAYRGYGRMTTLESHQASYNGMLKTLECIEREKLADHIMICGRGNVVLYENELQDGQWKHDPLARATVEKERNRSLTLQERRNYAEGFDKLAELLKDPKRQATPNEISAIERLRKEAYQDIEQTDQKMSVVESVAAAVVANKVKNPEVAQAIMNRVEEELERRAEQGKVPTVSIYDKNEKPKAQEVDRMKPEVEPDIEQNR